MHGKYWQNSTHHAKTEFPFGWQVQISSLSDLSVDGIVRSTTTTISKQQKKQWSVIFNESTLDAERRQWWQSHSAESLRRTFRNEGTQ